MDNKYEYKDEEILDQIPDSDELNLKEKLDLLDLLKKWRADNGYPIVP